MAPFAGIDGRDSADVDGKDKSDGETAIECNHHKISDLCKANEDDEVCAVAYLQGHHHYSCNFRQLKQKDEGRDDASTGNQRDEDVVLGEPFFCCHLLDKHVVMRVIGLKLR